MRKVKYNFNGEIQTWQACTKKEFLDKFGVYDDPDFVENSYRDEAVKKYQKINKCSANDALKALKQNVKKLAKALPNRKYLHIEFLDVYDKLHNPDEVITMLEESKKVWANVIG